MRIDELENSANSENERAKNKTGSSTEPFCNWPNEETSEKCASLEDRDSVRVYGRFLFLGVSEVSLEGFESEDSVWIRPQLVKMIRNTNQITY